MIARARRNGRARRRAKHDVVFYTPWIGSILSQAQSLPPGGAETQVLMLARQLAKRGLRVAIIVFGSAGEVPPSIDGVALVRRPAYRRRARLVEKLMEILIVWWSLWRAPHGTIVFRGAGVMLGFIAMYARAARRRLVFSTANVVDFDYRQLMAKSRDLFAYELGARLADEIVVQTEEQVELCRRAFRRPPVLIKSIAAPADPQPTAPVAFVWIGRLVSYKRPLEYVELARALPEAAFWMVGVPIAHRQDDRLVAEAVVEQTRSVPNLKLIAPCHHDEVQRLLALAVASVNTSDFEGMPNVLLEAWTRGVPALVLTHDPGEVITRHGLGGFADGDRARFVELAHELWVTRAHRPALSRRCRTYIAEHHAPEIIASQWVDVLSVVHRAGDDRITAEEGVTCAA